MRVHWSGLSWRSRTCTRPHERRLEVVEQRTLAVFQRRCRHRGIAGLLCAADLRGLVDVAERPGRTTPRGCGRSSSRTRSQPRLRHAPLVVAAWSPAQHSAVPPCLHRVRTTSALHRVGECIVCTNGSNGDRAHAKLRPTVRPPKTNICPSTATAAWPCRAPSTCRCTPPNIRRVPPLGTRRSPGTRTPSGDRSMVGISRRRPRPGAAASTVHCDAPQWCVDVAACLRAGGVADAAVIHTRRSGHPALGIMSAHLWTARRKCCGWYQRSCAAGLPQQARIASSAAATTRSE